MVVVPEIYHELEPKCGTVLAYDQAGAEVGNADKTKKELSSLHDSDARAALDYLNSHEACTEVSSVREMGICIGGHLAFRAAMNQDVLAAACFYATDIHKGGLGKGMKATTRWHARVRSRANCCISGADKTRTFRSKAGTGFTLGWRKWARRFAGSRSTDNMHFCATRGRVTIRRWPGCATSSSLSCFTGAYN